MDIDPDLDRVFAANGYPSPGSLPEGGIFGPFGWTLEQAQATTANWGPTIMNLAALQSGDGNTAGTAVRTPVGGPLDQLSEAANPEVLMRIRGARVVLTSILDFTADGAAVTAPIPVDYFEQLARNLMLLHKRGNTTYRYPLVDALSTLPDWAALASNDTAQGASGYRARDRYARVGMESGIEVDLSSDTLQLVVGTAVPLPASTTHRLTLWLDGAAWLGKRENRSGCGKIPASAVLQAGPVLAGLRLGKPV